MTKSAENIEKKIEAQLEKLKQLKAQKQAIEARENKAKRTGKKG
jgi:phage shock protein A